MLKICVLILFSVSLVDIAVGFHYMNYNHSQQTVNHSPLDRRAYLVERVRGVCSIEGRDLGLSTWLFFGGITNLTAIITAWIAFGILFVTSFRTTNYYNNISFSVIITFSKVLDFLFFTRQYNTEIMPNLVLTLFIMFTIWLFLSPKLSEVFDDVISPRQIIFSYFVIAIPLVYLIFQGADVISRFFHPREDTLLGIVVMMLLLGFFFAIFISWIIMLPEICGCRELELAPALAKFSIFCFQMLYAVFFLGWFALGFYTFHKVQHNCRKNFGLVWGVSILSLVSKALIPILLSSSS